jgi:mono/diheme cytochrome c family protein
MKTGMAKIGEYSMRTLGQRGVLTVAVCALVASVAFAAFAAFAAPALNAREKRGQALLERLCSPCHAVGRSGASPHRQAPPFRNLDQRYPIEQLEESLAEGIMSGHPDMPEFRFSAADVGAVIAYLRIIQER